MRKMWDEINRRQILEDKLGHNEQHPGSQPQKKDAKTHPVLVQFIEPNKYGFSIWIYTK